MENEEQDEEIDEEEGEEKEEEEEEGRFCKVSSAVTALAWLALRAEALQASPRRGGALREWHWNQLRQRGEKTKASSEISAASPPRDATMIRRAPLGKPPPTRMACDGIGGRAGAKSREAGVDAAPPMVDEATTAASAIGI